MSKKQEANARGQLREGQPLLYKRQQVTHGQTQAAPQITWMNITPHRSVTQPQRLSVSDMPPLHGPTLPLPPPHHLSPQMQRAASARVKLPPLPAAAAASSPRGTAHAGSPVASGHLELLPPIPRGTLAAGGAWKTPSLARRTEGLCHGAAESRGHYLPPLQPSPSLQTRTGSQPAWKHLGHSETTEELIKVQEGHGGNTCSDLFRDLGPYLREDRSPKSTLRTSKWLSGRQHAEGIYWPAQLTAHRKQLCSEDEEAWMDRLRQKTLELEGLKKQLDKDMFRATFSSLHH